jgi:hypothetical protein
MIVDCWPIGNVLNYGHSGFRCAFVQQEQCPVFERTVTGGGTLMSGTPGGMTLPPVTTGW